MLFRSNPDSLDELRVMDIPEYNELHSNSDILLKELTRFTLDRRGDWSDAFFEYLLF